MTITPHVLAALIPGFDSHTLHALGPWALLVVCGIIFAETGLLVGFILPGDSLLLLSGVVSASADPVFGVPWWLVGVFIAVAAFLGGEVGYLIGHHAGPRVFERKETGLFSRENVERTNRFFERFGPFAVIAARFVPIVRTFAPVAAGVGHMPWRRYTVFNAIGAGLWGFGLTAIGWLLHFIPPVAHFVERYVDLILLAAVVVTVIPALLHYLQARRRAQRAAAAAADGR